jgi:hypothetical protein
LGGLEERDATYRVPLAEDPLQPVQLPAIRFGLVRLEEIEAERGGAPLTPGRPGSDAKTVHVWVPQGLGGVFYEDDFVNPIFIGIAERFEAFDRALCERLNRQGPAKHVDRSMLRDLSATATLEP